jgi:hypothetical protein
MTVALIFTALVLTTGYAVLRPLGLAKGACAPGLLPGAGLAALACLLTWTALAGLPAPLPGIAVAGVSVAGFALIVVDREPLLTASRGFLHKQRWAAIWLGASLVVPIVSLSVAFAGLQVPLSPHDGAFHVETADAVRNAIAVGSWYPPGLSAVFGSALQLLPMVDTAQGATELGLALTLLIPVAVFGAGVAIWQRFLPASIAALLCSLTHLLAYYPQVWGGWPQLYGIVLVLGLWTLSLVYLDRPGWGAAVLCGLLVGAIVVVHGTELYTTAIVLGGVAIANWRRLPWRRLRAHLPAAALAALICAAPYLPTLLHWASGGGAFSVGYEDGQALAVGAGGTRAAEILAAFIADALGVDLPIRIVLVALGCVWVFRARTGRLLVVIAAVFVCLAIVASFFNSLPLVRQIYAATYPWSLPYRHLTFAVVPLSLLAGQGALVLLGGWRRLTARIPAANARRRLERAGVVLVPTWLILTTAGLTVYLSLANVPFDDDAVAMAWLRAHAPLGSIVANDGFADAGIWAPYKAGVKILEYRSHSDPATQASRDLVLREIGKLQDDPQAAAAACDLGVNYVYRGALNSNWQTASFPTVVELEASPALNEVFRHGNAAVFETRLGCDSAVSG